ncbi:MAG: valine--tRNA ligase [Hyphomicrobiales bacterium]|nr:MAG: valine--tRNA ligase [Hyphomicrobiales bacterium]
MLEKTFDAASAEARIYDSWEESGSFKAGANARKGADSFCIVLPPPNVTGSLHMGHAFNHTIQDIMIRYHRQQGRDVLWQPGMDHAGIATQMVVERKLAEKQQHRRELGREKFVEKIWEWKAESGGMIVKQDRCLGVSADWSRQRFTMDEGLSDAVLKVFVELHRDGLIYRDKRLVNWDPHFQTAISDIEVEQREVNGHLWNFKYPVEGTSDRYITIATTRPETVLGDTAVIVHPDDERYRDLIGKFVILPLVGRRIPILADDYVDMETGTGAMKVTPAHDFNDFDIGRRHDLKSINILDRSAVITLRDNAEFLADVPESDVLNKTIDSLHNVDRFSARKLIVAMLDEIGLLHSVDDHVHMVPHGDRSNVVVEPYLTDQWFVDAKTLAEPAIASVREGRTKFVPQSWDKTYYEWMENIQPWCISRQLWWGHRIPAWYGPDGEIFVEQTAEEAQLSAKEHYGKDVELTRDEDVLDTWFSSALWPFSTLGWPEKTPELEKYFMTDVLVTGHDIIFFWVARMMMMSLHFLKKEPFHTVYMHALVRDEKGAKMSKSKGNVIDPLDLIGEYGADAIRFTFAAMAAPGRDLKLAINRVAGYRNFGTKLWNATRFTQMNGCQRTENFDPSLVQETVNRWIVAETYTALTEVSGAIEAYRFNDAASGAYRFTWNTFCDWYLELTKPMLGEGSEAVQAETRATAAWVLDQILIMLHPMMPFITEELWTETGKSGPPRNKQLIVTGWLKAGKSDEAAASEVNWLIEVIGSVRSVRSEMNIPAAAKPELVFVGASDQTRARLKAHNAIIKKMARAQAVSLADEVPRGSAQTIVSEATICLPLAGVMDLDAELDRLKKEFLKIEKVATKFSNKLNNKKFVANAPAEIVEEQKTKLAEQEALLEKVRDAVERVESAR